MNLFELFVKVGVDDQASGKLGEITGKLGNGLKTAAKIGTAAVGVAATGITALTTAAVKSYAEYEQLVGGAELLFGEAFDTVKKNAEEAYKTVQMSQNEYLQQVNGFSTGLKTALGGNEKAAADLAHRIVVAEADIVAATGNTAENVQNAFNGIMKSNFTMLDNLQLGITPTKEGFQEVIDKVNEWNKANGEATNYQMGNLADMQSALVDYIEMQGLSGYASKEAAKTITGSLSSMRSAWKNLLVGVADDEADFETLIDNMVESVGAFADNILPRVEIALDGVVELVEKLFPKIIERLPELVSSLLPSIIDGALVIVETLVDSLSQNSELLVNSAIKIVLTLVDGIISMLPKLVEASLEIIISLVEGIATAIEQDDFIQSIVEVVVKIVEILTDADTLIRLADAGSKIMLALTDAIVDAIPTLTDAIPDIVENMAIVFIKNAPKMLLVGPQLVLKLIVGIVKAAVGLHEAATEILNRLLEGITNGFASVYNKGKEIVGQLLDGIKNAWEDVKNWFSNAWDNLFGGRKVEIDAEVNEIDADGSHRNGLRYVPYDGYVAELHKGERVLTAEESRAYNEGRNISVVQNIYSSAKTAADLMREAKWEQDRAVFGLV